MSTATPPHEGIPPAGTEQPTVAVVNLNTSTYLTDALETGGIFYEVPGGDLESVLRETIARFPFSQGVARETLLQLFMARESLGSTAIGDGIALPHIRFSGFPAGFHALQNLVALCFSKQLIPYKAPDDKPVQIIIPVVSSTVTHYFRIFRQLSYALHDASFRKAVMERQPPEQIMGEAKRLEKEAHNGYEVPLFERHASRRVVGQRL